MCFQALLHLVSALASRKIDAAAVFGGEVVLEESLADRLHLVVAVLLRDEEEAQSPVAVQSELVSLGDLGRHCRTV